MGIFNNNEYLTFSFKDDDEEHLVPSSFFKGDTIHKLKDHNNHVRIDNIASSTFGDLTDFLKGNHPGLETERIELMIQAAKQLGLSEVVRNLRYFSSPVEPSVPPEAPAALDSAPSEF